MKNKAWFFLLIFLCGSRATVSAFAEGGEESPYGSELSNDQMETDRQNAIEAGETCKTDCAKEEMALCEAQLDVTIKAAYAACLKKVAPFCARKCD
jgi:hypothetical protein